MCNITLPDTNTKDVFYIWSDFGPDIEQVVIYCVKFLEGTCYGVDIIREFMNDSLIDIILFEFSISPHSLLFWKGQIYHTKDKRNLLGNPLIQI